MTQFVKKKYKKINKLINKLIKNKIKTTKNGEPLQCHCFHTKLWSH